MVWIAKQYMNGKVAAIFDVYDTEATAIAAMVNIGRMQSHTVDRIYERTRHTIVIDATTTMVVMDYEVKTKEESDE